MMEKTGDRAILADADTCLGTGGIMDRPDGVDDKGPLTGHRQPKLA